MFILIKYPTDVKKMLQLKVKTMIQIIFQIIDKIKLDEVYSAQVADQMSKFFEEVIQDLNTSDSMN